MSATTDKSAPPLADRVVVTCLVGEGDPGWIWKAPGSVPGKALRDPAELRSWVKGDKSSNLLGPDFAELCAITVERLDGEHSVVRERDDKGTPFGPEFSVPKMQILPSFEGLLVLEEMSRCSDSKKWPWLSQFEGLLYAERQKRKLGIAAWLYVKERLLETAVTGPKFTSSRGHTVEYRREPLRKQRPQENSVAPDGWYKVQSLGEYKPPWEAFVDSRCGFYQDFYLVHWDKPHNIIDYSSMDNGGDVPGTTWEPDECIPDELDSFRGSLKSRWCKDQQNKDLQERKLKESTETAKPPQPVPLLRVVEPTPVKSEEPPTKVARIARPVRDVCSYPVKHIFEEPKVPTGEEAEKQIKSGWPRKDSDYPEGHGPITPPGSCFESCACMEDWLLGLRTKNEELEKRRPESTQAVENLLKMPFLSTKGEAGKKGGQRIQLLQPLRPPMAPEASALNEVVLAAMRALKLDALPLALLQTPDGQKETLPNLAPAYMSHTWVKGTELDRESAGFPFLPLEYMPLKVPQGIQLCVESGHLAITSKEELRKEAEAGPPSLRVGLMHLKGQDLMEVTVDAFASSKCVDKHDRMADYVFEKVKLVQRPAVREALEGRLASLRTPTGQKKTGVQLSVYIRCMAEVAQAARALIHGVLVEREPS